MFMDQLFDNKEGMFMDQRLIINETGWHLWISSLIIYETGQIHRSDV